VSSPQELLEYARQANEKVGIRCWEFKLDTAAIQLDMFKIPWPFMYPSFIVSENFVEESQKAGLIGVSFQEL